MKVRQIPTKASNVAKEQQNLNILRLLLKQDNVSVYTL